MNVVEVVKVASFLLTILATRQATANQPFNEFVPPQTESDSSIIVKYKYSKTSSKLEPLASSLLVTNYRHSLSSKPMQSDSARLTISAGTQTYNEFDTQGDTSQIVALGEDQRTLESLINDDKDDGSELAEAGFQAGEELYTGMTTGASNLVFQNLATNTDFFKSQGGAGGFFPSFQKYVNYFGGNDQYMDVTCLAGFNGDDADFTVGGGPNFAYSVFNPRGRAEVIEKATNYLIVFMMIQGSLENAVDSCQRSFAGAAQGFLDEAVAYYVGSETLSGPFYFSLAVSRCQNFNTCNEDGTSPINELAFEQFTALRSSLADENGGPCATSEAAMNEILSRMVIPLIQGTMRYAVFLGIDGDVDDKSKGEGAIFAQAVLPYIADCNAVAATTIFDQMKPVAGDPDVNFNVVKLAFEETYQCLGITVQDIGCYEGRQETCPTGLSPPSGTGPNTPGTGGGSKQNYNGYLTQEDTSSILALGEDQKTLEALINDNKDDSIELAENGFQAGEDLYTGATPGVSSLVFQQLATNTDFFKPSNGSLTYFPSFQKYVNYFGGNDQYMDVTCLAGFNGGDADFSVGGGPKFEYSVYNARGRADVIEKATNYLIVFMMIQASLENAVDSCQNSLAAEAQDYLDEAVAFYVGSETLNGPFFFNLAVARCGNFDTCVEGTSNPTSPINVMLFEKFTAMKSSLSVENGGGCANSEASARDVISKMVIPLIQGTLRYAVFLGIDGDVDDKSKGEGAIFAQATLPYIAACDASAANTIFEQMKPVSGAPDVDFDVVKDAFESTYACLGITVQDIGCYEGRQETCPTGLTARDSPAGPSASDDPSPSANGSSSSASPLPSWMLAATAAAAATIGTFVAMV